MHAGEGQTGGFFGGFWAAARVGLGVRFRTAMGAIFRVIFASRFHAHVHASATAAHATRALECSCILL